jgi:hypothetical protein
MIEERIGDPAAAKRPADTDRRRQAEVSLLLDAGVTVKRNDKAPPLAITGSIPFDDWFPRSGNPRHGIWLSGPGTPQLSVTGCPDILPRRTPSPPPPAPPRHSPESSAQALFQAAAYPEAITAAAAACPRAPGFRHSRRITP